jgi:hypothetical protein
MYQAEAKQDTCIMAPTFFRRIWSRDIILDRANSRNANGILAFRHARLRSACEWIALGYSFAIHAHASGNLKLDLIYPKIVIAYLVHH